MDLYITVSTLHCSIVSVPLPAYITLLVSYSASPIHHTRHIARAVVNISHYYTSAMISLNNPTQPSRLRPFRFALLHFLQPVQQIHKPRLSPLKHRLKSRARKPANREKYMVSKLGSGNQSSL